MHPRSKDRSGNSKLLADIRKQKGLPVEGTESETSRRSKYGAKLRALRRKKRD